MLTKFLVALDGTKESEVVLPYVAKLAAGLNASVVLHTSVERTSIGGLGELDSQLVDRVEAAARSRLKEIMGQSALQGVDVTAWVSSGSPAEDIVGVADNQDCDLIAMSTHGRSALARGVLGSVTDKVVHSTNIPVLTMTYERAETYHDPKSALTRVLVPLDGSPLAETILPYVGRSWAGS